MGACDTQKEGTLNRIESFSGPYQFLSNFHVGRYPIVIPDLKGGQLACQSLEHAFQAMKTDYAGERQTVAGMPTPGRAKRAGQKVTRRADWEATKNDVMLGLLRQKFLGDDRLGLQLLLTGEAELVEGNTWDDTYWGVCRGVGQHWLGRLLMTVRSEARTRAESLNRMRDRCGACPACITVTLTQRAIYAEMQPAGGGVNSQTVSMWNTVLQRNPGVRTQGVANVAVTRTG